MRLLAIVLLAAGACASRIPIEGAPCGTDADCPAGYRCEAVNECVLGSAPPARTGGMGGTTGMPDPPGAMPPPMPGPDLPTCRDSGPAPVRRLTPEEYRNSVFDLTGVPLTLEQAPDEVSRLDPAYVRLPVAPATIERITLVAEEVSAKATSRLSELVTCTPDPPGSSTCGRQFIEGFGARAFRRPLTQREIDLFLKAFEVGHASQGFAEGIRRVIEVALGSPQFLYRIDLGDRAAEADLVIPLTQWELATRLAYLVWVSPPDEALRAAAAAGRLSNPKEMRAEADRLLRDPRAERVREGFLERWLQVSAVRVAPKPPEAAPAFSIELREALVTSARSSFARLLWEGGQAALFDTPELMGDAAMARFYGLTAPPGPGFSALRPTGGQRRFGLLTLPALLAAHANGDETSPVARGLVFAQEVLCLPLPEPPPNIDAVSPANAKPGTTTRERMEEHKRNPACASCHSLFDPLGLGLENYDGFGRWRTHENGQLIDASGRLAGGEFDGPEGLARQLGSSTDVQSCLVKQWFRHVFGRDPLATEGCTIKHLTEAFRRGGMNALLLATIETQAFRTRSVGGSP